MRRHGTALLNKCSPGNFLAPSPRVRTARPPSADDLIHIRVADEGEAFAVRRPGRDVHRPLPAIYVSDYLWTAAFHRHQAKIDLLVIRMVSWIDLFGEADE